MPPSLPVRAARLCLVGIVAAMPLVPGAMGPAKYLTLLGLAALGGALLLVDTLARRSAPALGTPTDLAFGLWLAAMVPSVIAAANPPVAHFRIGVVVSFGLAWLLAVRTLRTPGDVRLLGAAVMGCAVVVSAVGLVGYQRFGSSGAAEVERAAFLSTPFFAHSYLAAQYVVMPFVGALVLLAERRLALAVRGLLAVGLVPMGAYLLVVGSRGAWLAIAGALLGWGFLAVRAAAGRRGRLGLALRFVRQVALWGGLAVVLVVVARVTGLLGAGAGTDFVERLLLVFDPEASEHNFSRLGVWGHTLELAADHLITGVGIGGYSTSLPSYHPAAVVVTHAHNQFLHVLAEMGLVGLAALLFVLGAARRAASRGAAQLVGDDERHGLFGASVAALGAGLVYFLFETPLQFLEAGSLIVVLLAIMTRAGCLSRVRVPSRRLAFGGLLVVAPAYLVSVPLHYAYAQANGPRRAGQRRARRP